MQLWARLRSLSRNLFRKQQVESQLEDEVRERSAARFLRRDAGGDLLIGEHVCIRANFVFKPIFDLLLAKKIV